VGDFIIALLIAKHVSERILKIGQHLAKSDAKTEWHLFSVCQHNNFRTTKRRMTKPGG